MDILACVALFLFSLFVIGFWRWTSPAAVEKRWQAFVEDARVDRADAVPAVPSHPNCRSAVTYVSLGNRVWLEEQLRQVLAGIPDIDKL